MPGENKEFESDLLKELTGHEDDGGLQENDDNDEQELPDDPENDQEQDDQQDDDEQEQEPDGLEEERAERSKRQGANKADKNDKQQQGKQQDKSDTSVVTDIFDPKLKLEERKGALFHNGKLIANAGRERRNFEGARAVIANERKSNVRLVGRLHELADAGREILTKYNELEKNKNMFEKADLTFDDQKLMFDVAVEYKKNPLNGIKLMLTKAKLAGVDIASLGVNGGGIDIKAITDQINSNIDERLKPVNEMTKAQADQAALAKQVNGFYNRNPEAEEFAETLPGKHQDLAGILAKARQTDIDNGREPKTLDEYWSKLHYELLKRGGITTLVTKQKQNEGQQQRNKTVRRPRAEKRKFNGDTSFYDIGQSVLADIRNLGSN